MYSFSRTLIGVLSAFTGGLYKGFQPTVKGTSGGELAIIEGGDYSQSELDAAKYLADQGNDVVLRPPSGTRANGDTSDLLVNGINYDVYTPITDNSNNIIRNMTSKNSQTVGIVLDLSETSVVADDLGNILARITGAIEKNGGTCNIKDVIVLPKGGN